MLYSFVILSFLAHPQFHLVAADEEVYYPLKWMTKELKPGENKIGYTYTLPDGFHWVHSGNFSSSHVLSEPGPNEEGSFKTPRKTTLEFKELSRSLFLDVARANTRSECKWFLFSCLTRILPHALHSTSVHINNITNFSIGHQLVLTYSQLSENAGPCIDASMVVPNPLRLPGKAVLGRIYFLIKYSIGPIKTRKFFPKTNVTAMFPITLDGDICDSIYKLTS
ncbi:hypothetical protein DSO57_1003226 [Entomophthora muscae]|uniref:Uncharacterized protein n=1 Tax=Entomophthora muscae TaxID=34485 RepID=A0ACC2TW78_9FUNG|nr:hypothetical protein DSO57_1003226 [Entomophthora muscae]